MATAPPKADRTIETPALAGKHYHETAARAELIRKWQWIMLAFVLAGINGFAVCSLVVLANKTRYIPYAIEVSEQGSVRKVGVPDPTWSPGDKMIGEEIEFFVWTTRGRILDPKVEGDFWQRAINHTTQVALTKLNEEYLGREARHKKGPIQVNIISKVMRSRTTWDVRWIESYYTPDNVLERSKHWRGIYTLVLEVPGTLQEIETNAKGVWFTSWATSEEQ